MTDNYDIDDVLQKQVENSYNNKDSFGMFKSIFKPNQTFQQWKVGEGQHWFDIILYRVGKNNPIKINGLKEGQVTYFLELYVHEQVGPSRDSYICLAKCFGSPCPICEYQEKLRKAGNYDKEEFKRLYPKRKALYNVHVLDTEEEIKKGVQVYYASFFNSERIYASLAKTRKTPDGHSYGSYIPFPSIKNGKTISFERQGTGKDNTQFLGHKFEDRDYVINPKLIEQAYTLDELIHIPTYEEVRNAFFGVVQDDEDCDEIDDSPFVEDIVDESAVDYDNDDLAKEDDNLCKVGGVFGEDTGMLEGCVHCNILEKCEAVFDENSNQKTNDNVKESKPRSSKKTGKVNDGPKARMNSV